MTSCITAGQQRSCSKSSSGACTMVSTAAPTGSVEPCCRALVSPAHNSMAMQPFIWVVRCPQHAAVQVEARLTYSEGSPEPGGSCAVDWLLDAHNESQE